MKTDKTICRFNRIYLILHLLLSAGLGIYQATARQWYLSLLAFASFFVLLVPNFLLRLLKQKTVPQLTTLIYLYCTLAFTIGMAFQAYHTIPYYDKAIHTLSGAAFSFLGLILYALLKPGRQVDKREFALIVVFTFSFSMMIAAVWEIYEYGLSFVTALDPQNSLGGVHDTMQDIIVCFAGAVLFILPEYLYFKKGRKDLFMASFERFTEQGSSQK